MDFPSEATRKKVSQNALQSTIGYSGGVEAPPEKHPLSLATGFLHSLVRQPSHTMTLFITPESVVQRQLDAYNARDVDALMATYAENLQQFEYPATLLVSGAAQLRERITVRFSEPNLHARLIRRIVMGQVVIDHEEVTRTFPEGAGKFELVAIYEVRDGRIATARFISGTKTLDPGT